MQKHEIFRFTAANKPAEEKTFALTNVIAVNKTIKRHRKKDLQTNWRPLEIRHIFYGVTKRYCQI